MYVVGITETCERLAFCSTLKAAEQFVGTLSNAEHGIYYIDGPCKGVIEVADVRFAVKPKTRRVAVISLYIDPKGYKDETGEALTKDKLEEYGEQVNDDAGGIYGYEGWDTKFTSIKTKGEA
jgi:hypothetical protein